MHTFAFLIIGISHTIFHLSQSNTFDRNRLYKWLNDRIVHRTECVCVCVPMRIYACAYAVGLRFKFVNFYIGADVVALNNDIL